VHGVSPSDVKWMYFILLYLCSYITTLGVDPEYRLNGLGLFLLDRICECIVDFRAHVRSSMLLDSICLHVKEDNYSAIRMYKKGGFTISKLLVDHYYFENRYHNALILVKKYRETSNWCIIS
jgi:ribosomal protein S18 acetylase RimI-like enzyme